MSTTTRTFHGSFNGGELTPEFYGQVDDSKYARGLALCRNFIPLPHGPVVNRPGLGFVCEAKNFAERVRLIPFTYSNDQTMILEFGSGYIRFHTQGATLMNGAAPYEVVTPYSVDDVRELHYVQSADVMTLVCRSRAPMELKRLGALNWELTAISFVSSLSPPGSVTAQAIVPGGATGLRDYTYVVTAVKEGSLEESVISSAVTCSNNLYVTGAYNSISWAVPAVYGVRYNVYLMSNGLYGFIGQTTGIGGFKDDNITPDLSRAPPVASNPFWAAGDYPGAVTYFEQRRVFAGSINKPQNIWMTRSGTESNMSYSIPSRDDDAINVRIAAREANAIKHLVPISDVIVLSGASEWQVSSGGAGGITPSTLSIKPQSYVGANNVQPVMVDNTLLYASARGGHMRELAYSWQGGGYITGDISLRAPHLFDGLDIVDMAYSKAPHPIVWVVSSSGKLLGLTYVPEQQIGAWHQHDTDGFFESVAVVPEGNEDAVYAVVRRTIQGVQRRYIERMASRAFVSQDQAFFVDSGAVRSGPPSNVVSGLTWLEGKTVSILADGAVHPSRVVIGGTVTLDAPALTVVVGLQIVADIQTLPVALNMPGVGFGRPKNINKAWLRVVRSSGIFVGADADKLTEIKQRNTEPYGTPQELKTEELEVMLTPAWARTGQVFIRQSMPLPLTLVSMTAEVVIGG